MALTPDQRAMLELVLQREQSYEQIGSLLDVDVPEVRKRARAALTELGGADPDSDVALTDYLLGQADPIGRADAVRHLKADPGARELAGKLIAQLQVIAPRAELPQLPGAVPRPATAAPQPPAEATAKADKAPKAGRLRLPSSLDRRQRQLFAALGGFLILIVAVGIAVSGVFGGDEDSSNDEQQQAAEEGLTRVQLEPAEGSNASGIAVFARVGDQPVVQINAADLEPTPEGRIYVVWLFRSNTEAIPIARERVGQNGNLSGPAPIPSPVVSILPTFTAVNISLASPDEVGQAIQGAERQGDVLPPYVGRTVLSGQIPNSVRTGNPEG